MSLRNQLEAVQAEKDDVKVLVLNDIRAPTEITKLDIEFQSFGRSTENALEPNTVWFEAQQGSGPSFDRVHNFLA